MQKVNPDKKSTINASQSQWQLTQQVNRWHKRDDISSWWSWRQQMMWCWHKQVTSATTAVAVMTSAGNPAVRGAHEARGSTSPKLWMACESARAIRWSWFFFEDVDQRNSILMVLTATRLEQPWWRVKCVEDFSKTLTSAWWCVDG